MWLELTFQEDTLYKGPDRTVGQIRFSCYENKSVTILSSVCEIGLSAF